MDDESQEQPGAEQSHDGAARDAEQPAAQIDINRLAEKVYRLMLADLRLSLARGEPVGRTPGS